MLTGCKDMAGELYCLSHLRAKVDMIRSPTSCTDGGHNSWSEYDTFLVPVHFRVMVFLSCLDVCLGQHLFSLLVRKCILPQPTRLSAHVRHRFMQSCYPLCV